MTEKIIDALEETNKWWKGKFEPEYEDREIYPEIEKFLDKRQILALTGLRRVGKTTIMLKIVEDYINKNFDAERIIYFSYDYFRDVEVKEILKVYARLMNKDLDNGKYLVLFDEIQKLENWEDQVKRIYDNYKNFKIIISGSESLFIRKKSKESLGGRCFEFHIHPLNFREFLHFKGVKIKNITLHKEEILRQFNQYLLCSGFPEVVDENEEFIEKYIKENVIEKTIYRDIPQVFPIKNPEVLEEILNIILLNPGQIINVESLGKDIGISRRTLSLYLNYLEKSFLIKKVYNFSINIRKSQRKLKKYYPTIISPDLIKRGETGKVFETMMIILNDAEFFWRDVYKNEVDIVKLINDVAHPMEIKYSRIETNAIKLFMKKFKADEGIILTYDKEKEIDFNGRKIRVLPFYKWVLENMMKFTAR